MRSFGETISNAASNPFSKFVEVDDWFASKRSQLEALENQLKGLLKSVESVVKQRKGRLREGWKREREREMEGELTISNGVLSNMVCLILRFGWRNRRFWWKHDTTCIGWTRSWFINTFDCFGGYPKEDEGVAWTTGMSLREGVSPNVRY